MNVTRIGSEAFRGTALTSVTIPNRVTTIGNGAFQDCSSLTSVTIGTSVTSIGSEAFRGCIALTSITSYALTPPSLESTTFEDVDISLCTLFVPIEALDLYLQAPIWQDFLIMPIGAIASGICGAQGDNLTWFLTADSVLTIRGSGDMMDFDMSYNFVPWSSTAIKTVVIEYGATSIGNLAFSNSHNLVSVSIPNSVTRIGERAFATCINLVSMDIPSSVTNIGDLAFADCRSLTSVVVPEGVTTIGEGVFLNARSLISVSIPSTVTSIGDFAFFDNRSLTTITCYALIPPTLGTMVFFDVNTETVSLLVPAQSVELYKQTPIWRDFLIKAIENETSLNETQTAQIFIFPNPVTDSFQIGGIEESALVTISDINGRIVFQRVVAPNERISASHFSQGIYFVNANGKTMKMIK